MIRDLLMNCREGNKKEIKKFIASAENLDTGNCLHASFKAVANAYRAKTVISPLKKIQYLATFNKEIMSAVESANAENRYEIVFLRYLIESNIPKGLGFSQNILQDKKELEEQAVTLEQKPFSSEYKQFITNVLQKLG